MSNTLEIREQRREGVETEDYQYQICLPNTRITADSIEISDEALDAAVSYITEQGVTRVDLPDEKRWRVETEDGHSSITVDTDESKD